MKNKGFTLIELLAVIVILAIIALIAVPIIINIINDSRESGYKRSVELYGKAVEQGIATYQINKPNNSIAGTYATATLEAIEGLSVNYEGSRVVCSNIVVNENGTIYMSGCSVGGHTVEYTYGTEPANEEQAQSTPLPRYYYIGGGNINDGLPQGASSTNTYSAEYPYYLAFDSADGETIDKASVCVVRNNEENCVQVLPSVEHQEYIYEEDGFGITTDSYESGEQTIHVFVAGEASSYVSLDSSGAYDYY